MQQRTVCSVAGPLPVQVGAGQRGVNNTAGMTHTSSSETTVACRPPRRVSPVLQVGPWLPLVPRMPFVPRLPLVPRMPHDPGHDDSAQRHGKGSMTWWTNIDHRQTMPRSPFGKKRRLFPRLQPLPRTPLTRRQPLRPRQQGVTRVRTPAGWCRERTEELSPFTEAASTRTHPSCGSGGCSSRGGAGSTSRGRISRRGRWRGRGPRRGRAGPAALPSSSGCVRLKEKWQGVNSNPMLH